MTIIAQQECQPVRVRSDAESLTISIEERRHDILALFAVLSDTKKQQFALDAWSIGLRALMNAQAQAQEARLQDVGKTLLDDIQHQLDIYVETQQQTVASVLSKYFDPNDGQVTQRLRDFVDNKGVLAPMPIS